MINGRFKREKADLESLGKEGEFIYTWFKALCPMRIDKCDPTPPYDKAIEFCVAKYKPNEKCRAVSKNAFKEYCKEAKDEIPSCYQFYSTTTTVTSTNNTINSNNMMPFIIGGVVGIIAILAIGIGIYCYCKKKKASGQEQSMTGTTTGGTTATGTTTKTRTKTNTGTTKAGTTTGAPTARY